MFEVSHQAHCKLESYPVDRYQRLQTYQNFLKSLIWYLKIQCFRCEVQQHQQYVRMASFAGFNKV